MKKLTGWLSRHKKLLIVLAVLIVLVAVWSVYSTKAAADEAKQAGAQVQTFSLSKGDLSQTLSLTGNVQSAAAQVVTSPLTLPVKEIFVEVGDTVAEGDALVSLDDSTLTDSMKTQQAARKAEQDQSALSIAQAQRRLEDARNTKKLLEERSEDALSGAARDDSLRQASLSIEDAQDALSNVIAASKAPSASSSSIAELKRQQAQCQISAPISGVITVVSAIEGAVGTQLLTLEDPNSVEVQAMVREYDVNRIKVGQKVTFTSGAKDSFTGQIAWVAPKATVSASGDVVYEVKCSIADATNLLRLGMSARIQVILSEKQNVFNVPIDAVGTDENGNAIVWQKLTDETGTVRFEAVQVVTGMETDLMIEISGTGLAEGMELRSFAEEGEALV